MEKRIVFRTPCKNIRRDSRLFRMPYFYLNFFFNFSNFNFFFSNFAHKLIFY
jgi:hypothetical protein